MGKLHPSDCNLDNISKSKMKFESCCRLGIILDTIRHIRIHITLINTRGIKNLNTGLHKLGDQIESEINLMSESRQASFSIY